MEGEMIHPKGDSPDGITVSDDITLVEKAALSLTEPSRARHVGRGSGRDGTRGAG
jgi:hypothetical protein